ncbi:zincin-like metallopeptidase domain-containing protein, partial [Burkholderia cenocepacia]|uniref:zincin-like metallopeptidase domain-containing protein n=1 Tax=Burkholderia cenocepacia TaxID=95486 RepID=UPI00209B6EFA
SLMTAGFDNPNFLTYLNVQEMEKTRQEAHTIITEASDKFKAGELSAMDYARDRAKAEKLFVKLEAAGMVDRDKPIHVQKGAISTPIFKAVDMEIDVQKTKRDENGNPITEDGMVVMEDGKAKIKVMAFSANVFNASQVANLKQVYEKTYDFEPHAEAEIHIKAMMEKTDLKIEHNAGGRAYYSVKEHKVVMPEKERFEPGAYYDTLFHEIGHSTGP